MTVVSTVCVQRVRAAGSVSAHWWQEVATAAFEAHEVRLSLKDLDFLQDLFVCCINIIPHV